MKAVGLLVLLLVTHPTTAMIITKASVVPPSRRVYAARRASVLHSCSQATALQDLGAVVPPVSQDCLAAVLRSYIPPKCHHEMKSNVPCVKLFKLTACWKLKVTT
jgi:hypothetical protein